jgi:hypothetical protein
MSGASSVDSCARGLDRVPGRGVAGGVVAVLSDWPGRSACHCWQADEGAMVSSVMYLTR